MKLQNGAGTHGVSVEPAPGTSFCDGRDHKIVVKKVRFDVTLTVDNLPSKKVTGPKGPSSVDNNGKYFIGGIPCEYFGQFIFSFSRILHFHFNRPGHLTGTIVFLYLHVLLTQCSRWAVNRPPDSSHLMNEESNSSHTSCLSRAL